MIKQSKNEKIFTVFNYIFLGLLAFTTVYPFIYTISISLSTTAEALRGGFHLYPKEISFLSYKMVLSNKDVFIGYGNTIYRTVLGTFLVILMTSMFAYPLSRKYMPDRKLYTFMVLFTMLFAGGLIPTYLLIKKLNLIDNRLVYVLPGMISAFNVIIVRSFFQSLPESLQESAKLDGANEFQILFQIIMPLSKPVLATVALWSAVGHWNAWFDSMLYMTSSSKQVLQTFLQRIVLESNVELIKLLLDRQFGSRLVEIIGRAIIKKAGTKCPA